MSDDALTAYWPGVQRDGIPELIGGSDRRPGKYRIHTTPLPAGGRGADWLAFFNSQLSRPPVSGYHDGSSLVVECGPDDEAPVSRDGRRGQRVFAAVPAQRRGRRR